MAVHYYISIIKTMSYFLKPQVDDTWVSIEEEWRMIL